MNRKDYENLRAFTTGEEQPHKDATTFIGQPTEPATWTFKNVPSAAYKEAVDFARKSTKSMDLEDYEVDLEHADLLVNGAAGVYVPQRFAEWLEPQEDNSDYYSGISKEDLAVLRAGPSYEHYWEAWADVLDNAKLKPYEDETEYFLHQENSDLWLVPEKAPKDESVTVMGHRFLPFGPHEWSMYAGAEPGSLIHYCEDQVTVLIYHPESGRLSEMVYDEELKPNGCLQRDWTYTVVLEG